MVSVTVVYNRVSLIGDPKTQKTKVYYSTVSYPVGLSTTSGVSTNIYLFQTLRLEYRKRGRRREQGLVPIESPVNLDVLVDPPSRVQ